MRWRGRSELHQVDSTFRRTSDRGRWSNRRWSGVRLNTLPCLTSTTRSTFGSTGLLRCKFLHCWSRLHLVCGGRTLRLTITNRIVSPARYADWLNAVDTLPGEAGLHGTRLTTRPSTIASTAARIAGFQRNLSCLTDTFVFRASHCTTVNLGAAECHDITCLRLIDDSVNRHVAPLGWTARAGVKSTTDGPFRGAALNAELVALRVGEYHPTGPIGLAMVSHQSCADAQ